MALLLTLLNRSFGLSREAQDFDLAPFQALEPVLEVSNFFRLSLPAPDAFSRRRERTLQGTRRMSFMRSGAFLLDSRVRAPHDIWRANGETNLLRVRGVCLAVAPLRARNVALAAVWTKSDTTSLNLLNMEISRGMLRER